MTGEREPVPSPRRAGLRAGRANLIKLGEKPGSHHFQELLKCKGIAIYQQGIDISLETIRTIQSIKCYTIRFILRRVLGMDFAVG